MGSRADRVDGIAGRHYVVPTSGLRKPGLRGTSGSAIDSLELVVDASGTIEFVPDSVTMAPDSSTMLLIFPLVAGRMAPSTHFTVLAMTDSSVIRDTYANASLAEIFLLVTAAAEGETALTYSYRGMSGSATVTVKR